MGYVRDCWRSPFETCLGTVVACGDCAVEKSIHFGRLSTAVSCAGTSRTTTVLSDMAASRVSRNAILSDRPAPKSAQHQHHHAIQRTPPACATSHTSQQDLQRSKTCPECGTMRDPHSRSTSVITSVYASLACIAVRHVELAVDSKLPYHEAPQTIALTWRFFLFALCWRRAGCRACERRGSQAADSARLRPVAEA